MKYPMTIFASVCWIVIDILQFFTFGLRASINLIMATLVIAIDTYLIEDYDNYKKRK